MLHISLSRDDFGNSCSSRKLGGVEIYCCDDDTLHEEMEVIGASIRASALKYLSTAKNVLSKASREAIEKEYIKGRLFSALLGWQMHLGYIDSIICESQSGKIFYVYIHKDNISKFNSMVEKVKIEILNKGRLNIQDVEGIVFGNRSYNTWSSSTHILSRLARLGFCEQSDKYTFYTPTELQNAIRCID